MIKYLLFGYFLLTSNIMGKSKNDSSLKVYHSYPNALKKVEFVINVLSKEKLSNKESLSLIKLIEKEYPDIKNKKSLLNLYILAAKTYRKNYDYQSAITYGNKAKELAKELKNNHKEGDIHRLIGNLYYDIGLFEKAYHHYFESLKIYEDIKDNKGIAITSNLIANSFADQQNKEKAIYFYHKSLKTAKNIQDSTLIQDVLHNLGFMYMADKEYDSAEKYLKESISLAHQLKKELNEGVSYMALSEVVFSRTGDDKTALEYFRKASDIFEKYDSKIHIARLNINYSEYYKNKKEFGKSIEYAQKAYQIAVGLNLATMKIPVLQQLYDIYTEKNDTSNANKYGILYYKLRDSLESKQDFTKISELETAYKIEKNEQAAKMEKQKQEFITYLISVTGGLFLIIIFIIIFNRYKLKRKQTELDNQKLNYELDMKNKELTLNIMSFMQQKSAFKEISEKLRNFQTENVDPKSKSILNLAISEIEKSSGKNIWKEFEVRFKDVQSSFYNSLIEKYPDLTPNEIRLAAFIRLNLTTKDISELTGKRVATLEIARSRLRKKLGINNTHTNLTNFLQKI